MTQDPAPGFRDQSMGEITRATVKGAVWMTFQKWAINLSSLVVFVILGRLLAPKAFGLVASANVIILFLRIVVDAGVSTKLVQRLQLSREHIDTAFWTAVGVGALLTGAVAAGAPLVALMFGQPDLTNVVRALSVVFVFASLDRTQSALLDRGMAFRVQAVRGVVAALASSGIAIGAAYAGAGVWALVAQTVSFELVNLVLLWSLTTWRPRRRFSLAHFRELMRFGSRYGAIQILFYLNQNVDNFLIGIFLGPVSLGYYVVGYRVLIVFNEALSSTVNRVTLATFSRLQDNREELHRVFYQVVGLSSIAALPIYAGLALVAPRLVPVLFGTQWGPSIAVMQVLAAAGLLQASTSFTHTVVIALGRVDDELRWNLAVTAAQVLGFIVAVNFGIVAVACALSIVTVVALPARLLLICRWSGLQFLPYFRRWLGPAAATTVMAAAVIEVTTLRPFGPSALEVLLAQLLVGAIVYPLALVALDRAALRECRSVIRMLRSRGAANFAGNPE